VTTAERRAALDEIGAAEIRAVASSAKSRTAALLAVFIALFLKHHRADICRKDQLTYGPEPRRTFVHSITRIELKWIGVGNAVNDRHALRKKSPSGESIFLQCFG
jgi:hypothetical protein